MSELIHHVELWMADLELAKEQWGPVLVALGCEPYQLWANGISWRKDNAYIVIEQSPALVADPRYDRMRAGLNHLAVRGNRATIAAAHASGWVERVDTGDAVHMIDGQGFELEIRLDGDRPLVA